MEALRVESVNYILLYCVIDTEAPAVAYIARLHLDFPYQSGFQWHYAAGFMLM